MKGKKGSGGHANGGNQLPSRDDRIHTERDSKKEFRTKFQRDRDRILHTSAFRRLAGVTQVVAAHEEGHLLHNRLTHSIKVAQVARRLAEKVIIQQPTECRKLGGIDPDVVEAAALAHDLGHPPFGHVAEVELDDVARASGLADAFEGNAQTFRIVTKLAIRDPNYAGLNLTRATLNAILKYPWTRSTDGSKRERKWGAFDTESDELHFARQLCPGDERKSAEAELMDWADDIAYSVHDVEDFYRVGMIPLHRLASKANDKLEVERFLEGAFARRRAEGLEYDAKYSRDQLRASFYSVRQLFPTVPYSSNDFERGQLRVLTSKLIARFVNAIKLRVPAKTSEARMTIRANHEQVVTMLKELTWFYVINNPSLAAQQYGHRQVVAKLYSVLEQAAIENDVNLFPAPPRQLLERIEQEDEMSRAQRKRLKQRVVVDVISNLTEQQALDMYQRIECIAPGSALDPLY